MLSISEGAFQICAGWHRRHVLQLGGGLFGLSLPRLLQAEATVEHQPAKCKSVIFMMLFGGPSQLETYDMKPLAPDIIRGPFQPIACRTPELLISEHLPRTAEISDKFCVVRTMSHDFNDHSGGGHYLQTGRRWHIPIGGGFAPTPKDWPSMGSVVELMEQQHHGLSRDLPGYMVVPNLLGRLQEAGQYPRPGEYAGWLGRRYNPVTTQVDKKSMTDNPYWRNCTDEELTFQIEGTRSHEGVTLDRLRSRQSLLTQFDGSRQRKDRELSNSGYTSFEQRAWGLVTSDRTRAALDIKQEPIALRDRYGRHLFGQASLMACRLVEAGVRYVTVHYDCVDGYSWDSHRNSDDVKKNLLPTFDQAYSALLIDLDQRGLLQETLVVAVGEMGRTPKANANWGRDHWSTLFPAVLAGGGVAGGRTYGQSDKDAAYALEKPVSPEDLAATVYWALGIDPEFRVVNSENRPTPITENGIPVESLWL